MRGVGPLAGATACTWLLILFTMIPALPSTAAHHTGTVKPMGISVNETITLPMNNWTAYQTDLQSTDRLVIDVRVLSGSAVDVYVVPSGGLAAYRSDQAIGFSYYEAYENSSQTHDVFSRVSGTVFVIVDNVDLSAAQPTGNVTVRVGLGPEPPGPIPWLVVAVCGIGFGAAIAVGITLSLRQRKQRRALAPPPPPPPPPPP